MVHIRSLEKVFHLEKVLLYKKTKINSLPTNLVMQISNQFVRQRSVLFFSPILTNLHKRQRLCWSQSILCIAKTPLGGTGLGSRRGHRGLF